MNMQVDQYFIETALTFGDYEKYQDCFLIKRTNADYILYIPNSMTKKPFNVFSEPEYEGANLKVIGGSGLTTTMEMFRGCKAKSIDLSSLNISNIKSMQTMFADCRAKSINFGSIDTSNVTDMKYMFAYCTTKSLDLRSFDVSNVTGMGYTFMYCKAESIDLTSFKTSSKTYMYDMFKYCNSHIKATDSNILEAYNHRIK